MMKVYEQSKEMLLEELESRREGLTADKAKEILEQKGENVLQEGKRKSIFRVFLEQFADLLVVILIAAAVISMISGNVESTIVIFSVIILNPLSINI